MEKALNTKEAAEYLSSMGVEVSPGTMNVWRSQGRGPRYRKIGRWVKYVPTDLDDFGRGQVVETVDTWANR